MPVPWNLDDTNRLTELWPELSASQIGAELQMTRNAVIGKANRMGLKKLPQQKTPPRKRHRASQARVRPPGLSKSASLPGLPVALPMPTEGGISIMGLEPHHCRAVIGTGDDGLARYCGLQKEGRIATRIGGSIQSPYCVDHSDEYYRREALVR